MDRVNSEQKRCGYGDKEDTGQSPGQEKNCKDRQGVIKQIREVVTQGIQAPEMVVHGIGEGPDQSVGQDIHTEMTDYRILLDQHLIVEHEIAVDGVHVDGNGKKQNQQQGNFSPFIHTG